jgi:integrase
MALTDIAIRKLKPAAARYEKPAGHGLYVIVQPSGAKSYAVRYRFAGTPRKMTLPGGITLAAARKATADALYEVAQGHDPGAAKLQQRQARRLAAQDTFQAVAEEYLKREGRQLRSVDDRRATLQRLVYPEIGDRAIADIRRKEIIRLLDAIDESSGPVMADRTLAYIRKIMNWHAVRDEDYRSPIVRGMARTKPKDRARERTLTDEEVRAVWKAAGATDGPFGAFVQFVLLTAARRTEAAEMKESELSGGDWTLPANRNKTGVNLLRPLSKAAQAVLAKVPRIAGCDFVFSTDGRSPISGFSRFKKKLDARSGVSGCTIHDLRRTARTLMSRAGVNSDHAERCLGHVIGGVRGDYDRHEYYDEKRQVYAALAALIERIANPPTGNVTSLATEKKKKKRA